MTDSPHTGMWLSDVPLSVNEGARGDVLLRVDLPLPEGEIVRYEWVQADLPYREFLLPAAIINPIAKVRVAGLATDEAPREWWERDWRERVEPIRTEPWARLRRWRRVGPRRIRIGAG